jgi:hypothetical protein
MRLRRIIRCATLVVAALLLTAACGGDDDTEPAAEPAPDSADGDSVQSAETTTSSTIAPIPEGGVSVEGLQLSAVVFGDSGHVTLTNTSDSEVTLDGLWLCNRPAYVELSGSLAPGESTDVPASDLADLAVEGGEAALYSSDSFDSADDMIDYVQWGTGGGRGEVAVAAGLWPEGVTVTPTAELIELSGVPGDPEAWS